MPYPINPLFYSNTPAQPTQRQRIAKLAGELKRRDPVGHAAMRWVVANNLDNLDAVERIMLDKLRDLDSNDQTTMQDELRCAGCN